MSSPQPTPSSSNGEAWRRWLGPAAVAWAAACAGALALAGCATELSTEELAAEYYNLGNAYLRLERYELAVGYYERSLLLADDAEARYNLALALQGEGRFDESLAELDLLLADDATNALVLELRAMALHRAGQDQAAIDAYLLIEELHPENEIAPYNRALLLWGRGDTAAAAVLLEALLDRHPDDQDVLFNLALLSSRLGELADAEELWARYLEESPTDAAALLELALVQTRRERFAEALDTLAATEAAVAEDDSRRAVVQFERAAILLTEVEDPRAGLAAMRAALSAGYRDRDRIAELLARPDLLERDAVAGELRDHNLEPEQSGEPAVSDGR